MYKPRANATHHVLPPKQADRRAFVMPGASQQNDGLLLLLQAAKKLDQDGCSRSTHDEFDRKTHVREGYDRRLNSSYNGTPTTSKKHLSGIRCTHNELEKSRRAHLRACMENLKEQLHFDNDIPRVTMLTVLRKATSTILYLRQKNLCLETCEDNEKQRCAQLIKKRQFLKKKLEERRNRSLKLQSWRERNRNCSECSVATTSSDDSELDQQLRRNSSLHTASLGSSTENSPTRICCYPLSESGLSAPGCQLSNTSRTTGLDVYETSSSDSGFEEVTIATNGTTIQERVAVFCGVGGS